MAMCRAAAAGVNTAGFGLVRSALVTEPQMRVASLALTVSGGIPARSIFGNLLLIDHLVHIESGSKVMIERAI